MIRRPPRSTHCISSAASDVYKRQDNFWNQAVDFAFSHRYKDALTNIDKALEKVPDLSKYAIEKAEILCEQGKPEEALSFLTEGKFVPPEPVAEQVAKIREAISWDQNLLVSKSEHEKIARLIKWAEDNDMDTGNIKVVCYSPDFRGVQARRRVRAGERVITARREFLVTVPRIVESSELAKKVVECGVKLDYTFATALACMIYEAKSNPKPWWQPYIESFPESADTFPYFFSEKEKEYLRGTIWESSMKSEMEESLREYNEICDRLPEFKEMTSETYLKLTTLVCSRYFGAESLPDQKLAVPVIDMFNYYVDKAGQTSWHYYPEENAFAVTAVKDIRWGDVIALNYGAKPNGRYLLYYGFIPDNNTYMYIYIDPVISDSDPLLKEKQELLGYANGEKFLYSKEFYCDWSAYFEENDTVMSACRFAVYAEDVARLRSHLEKFDMSERYKSFRLPPLSAENEVAALELLKKIIVEKAKKYPNTLEEDETILETQKDLTLNARNALTVRIGELRAHAKIIEFADEMIKLLKSPENAKGEIEKMDKWYVEYAKRCLLPLLTQP
eukprot:TRINITY_DN11275_c0_g1_i7.p1 TRINITY_DN11275_c0_g1~~TRINITY_DN11275_c0_g1_i7.p1  ORF type:complete len:573 (+),score=169.69 TRINITY_DN11275_c0_g1_i7:42-1721(+)